MNNLTQRGLSLVELVVALLIGSLLILAGAHIMLDHKHIYLFQRAQADNQGNGRFTLQWLDQELARAGYKRRPDQSLSAAFPALSEAQSGVSGCAFESGQVVSSVNASTLCIRYQPSDKQDVDCLGNGRPANASALARPYAEPAEAIVEKLAISSSQHLICTSKDGAASLVEGIADLRFDYGVSPSGTHLITHYTSTPSSSATIRSVRYTALLSTPVAPTTADQTSRAWDYWNARATYKPTAKRLYQVIKGTTTLRNLTP